MNNKLHECNNVYTFVQCSKADSTLSWCVVAIVNPEVADSLHVWCTATLTIDITIILVIRKHPCISYIHSLHLLTPSNTLTHQSKGSSVWERNGYVNITITTTAVFDKSIRIEYTIRRITSYIIVIVIIFIIPKYRAFFKTTSGTGCILFDNAVRSIGPWSTI